MSTEYVWRYKEAPVCNLLTGGKFADLCHQTSDDSLWKCMPNGGKTGTSTTPEEWHRVGGVVGTIVLQGNWDAATNSPDITTTITAGYAWAVSVAGATDLGGITDWKIGDIAVKTATGWIKVDNTEPAHNDLSGLQGGAVDEYYHVTSAEKSVLENTSGENTGDQDISGKLNTDQTLPQVTAGTFTFPDVIVAPGQEIGVATASSSYAGYFPADAFTGIPNNPPAPGWKSKYYSGVGSIDPEWLQYQLPTAIVVTKYKLCPIYGQGYYWNAGQPVNWLFEGSNNGVDWITLDTRTGYGSLPVSQFTEFTFSNSVAYSYYRLYVTYITLIYGSGTVEVGTLLIGDFKGSGSVTSQSSTIVGLPSAEVLSTDSAGLIIDGTAALNLRLAPYATKAFAVAMGVAL